MSKRPTRRLGLPGYVALLALLRDTPSTTLQIHLHGGIGRTAVARIITTLRQVRRVRISGWVMAPHTPTMPVWTLGDGPDVPLPLYRPNGKPVDGARCGLQGSSSSEVLALHHLLRMLECGHPSSAPELCDATGMHRDTVGKALTALVQHGFARIAEWDQRGTGGKPLPLFEAGAGQSARRPKATPRHLLCRSYRARARVFAATKLQHVVLSGWAGCSPRAWG